MEKYEANVKINVPLTRGVMTQYMDCRAPIRPCGQTKVVVLSGKSAHERNVMTYEYYEETNVNTILLTHR